MILIISHTELDLPTEVVFNWLNFYKIKCVRLNGIDILNTKSSIEINAKFPDDFRGIKISKIKAVWMRRWIRLEYFNSITIDDQAIFNSYLKTFNLTSLPEQEKGVRIRKMLDSLRDSILDYKINEFKGFSHYLFELLRNVPTLGTPFFLGNIPTKANQINFAIKVGLKVPSTLITNSKNDLLSFWKKYNKIIIKNISDITTLFFMEKLYVTYTSSITIEDIKRFPEIFPVSLFQERIEKKFEVRVFYLNRSMYSMAIFSANDSRTKEDFRLYNSQKPNRTIPFKLPLEIENKIIKLMDQVKLVSGSLDFIYTKDKEYIFLEINPVGQFGMVSLPCNYGLEKIVAKHLIEMSKYA